MMQNLNEKTKYYLAIDLGASSGRHIIGYLENGEIKTEEVYRFANGPKLIDGHLTWDISRLFSEVKNGIKEALKKYPHIESLSIDTWGVDYVLMNEDKEILPCYAYRDNRTEEAIKKVHALISFDRLYEITGTQFQPFNTIYQLFDDKEKGRLESATDFLLMPEYLMYKLTGIKKKEYTNASTTGLMDGETKTYSKEIINALGLKESLFGKLYKPGETLGYLKDEIAQEVGGNLKVKLCATHDTASAVEAIKMKENSPYISSGTWSLLGIKIDKIINTEKAKKANYSNEYGPNYIRFQKNIMGLWIIQCLAKEMNLTFPKMVEMSRSSNYEELFDVNDECFLSSKDMKEEIKKWFINSGKTPPKEDKDLINATYRSLAYSYKVALDELEDIAKKEFKNIYIVGGGAKNLYLNELTEKFTKCKVIALPIEASSIGNLLSQMED